MAVQKSEMRLGKKFMNELIILRNVDRPGNDSSGLISELKLGNPMPPKLSSPGKVLLVKPSGVRGAARLNAKISPTNKQTTE